MAQRRDAAGRFDFGRQVLGWAGKVHRLRTEVFRDAFMKLADEMQTICPRDTHFLMSSLEASTSGMPRMSRPNPRPNAGPGTFSWDRGQVVGVVESAEPGEKIYLGYTAEYAGMVHDGHGNQPARPWVMLVAQRWSELVREAAGQVKARSGG